MPPRTSLTPAQLAPLRSAIARADKAIARTWPGRSADRQPIHVVYGGAHLYQANAARKLGDLALRALETYAPEAGDLTRALNLSADAGMMRTVYARVVEKLRREPVEDQRIDFEDGYGHRPDAEEDGHAEHAALEMAKGLEAGTLPPFVGIRIKALTSELFPRATRTLDVFVSTLAKASRRRLPPHFVVTLPKVTRPEQVAVLVRMLGMLEKKHRLPSGALKLELMIEMPQALLSEDGRVPLRALVAAGGGRCVAAHFGAYDYTAAMDVTATHQTMSHAAADWARQMMQVALAGTGVWVVDGATNVMPVGPHRAEKGETLTHEQLERNREVVFNAWRLAYRHIRNALVNGLYQGWDLHPAQLPIRYAATYAFFLEGLPEATARLRAFLARAAQATRVNEIFDDAATGQGLLNFFLRGIACGALTENDAREAGLSLEELRTRSFLAIVTARRKR
ncbi:MAG: phosphoenolpyruvate kinase [Myxococcaceae bacterium]|nr:phosphoenolpyruvate kinase [Myxococcaceae bacterium]